MHASHALSSLKIGGSVLVPSVLESTGFQNTPPSSQLEEEEDWGWGGAWPVGSVRAVCSQSRWQKASWPWNPVCHPVGLLEPPDLVTESPHHLARPLPAAKLTTCLKQ